MPATYYPSTVIAVGLRFDDAIHLATNRQALARGQIHRIQTGGGQLTQSDYKKLLSGKRLVKPADSTAVADLDAIPESMPLLVGSPSDELSWVLNVVPRSSSTRKPGYRRAGESNMTVGFHELPVNPELLKAAQVRVFHGTVDPQDAATGYTQLIEDVGRELRRSIITTHNAAGEPDLSKLAFWGLADKWKVHYGEDSTVTASGRDLRSIFIDTPVPRGLAARLKLDRPIDEVVQQICELHPLAGKLRVRVQPADWDGPIPAPCAKGNLTRIQLGATKNKTQNNPALQPSKLKMWDLICQYAFLVGAVPYFRGPDLIVRPARSLYDLRDRAVFDPRIKTPFAQNAVRSRPDMTRFAIRQMIVGHNLSSLDIERKFTGGERPRVIEVVSLDVSSKSRGAQKLLIARWPEDLAAKLAKKHATKESPSGQLAENEVWRVPVFGIKSQSQLREIARAIFETTARYEIEGSFETHELASYVGTDAYFDPFTAGNADPDLLRLEPGDPIEFSIAADTLQTRRAGEQPIVGELNQLAGKSFDEAAAYVERRLAGAHASSGDTRNLARSIVATYRQSVVETQSIYRCNEATFNWNDGKIQISAQFHNYIEAAYGAATDKPEKPTPQKALQTKVAKSATGIGSDAWFQSLLKKS